MTEELFVEDTAPTAYEVKLGDKVQYADSQGKAKLAMVLGTQDSVGTDPEDEDASVPAVQDGAAHLLVFSPTGNTYVRHNVPSGKGPNTFAPIA